MSSRRQHATGEVIAELVREAGLIRTSADVSVKRLSGGHSHVTWIVRQGDDPADAYVVKVAQADGPLAPYDVEREVSFMRLATAHGLASPEVVHVSIENRLDTQLFVMRYVEGDAPTPRQVVDWLAAHPSVDAQDLAMEVVSTLVAMTKVRPASPDGEVSMADYYRAYVNDTVASMSAEIDGLVAVPESIRLVHNRLVAGADILGEHPRNVVHGDFRFGNLMLNSDGGVAAILDWERGMWGHPLHDLAYLSLPSMGYRGRVAGLVTDEDLMSLWKRASGEEVDVQALAYLRTVSIFTELCSCIRALGAYMHGRGRTSLLRILPIIARHEVDVLDSLEVWRTNGRPA